MFRSLLSTLTITGEEHAPCLYENACKMCECVLKVGRHSMTKAVIVSMNHIYTNIEIPFDLLQPPQLDLMRH